MEQIFRNDRKTNSLVWYLYNNDATYKCIILKYWGFTGVFFSSSKIHFLTRCKDKKSFKGKLDLFNYMSSEISLIELENRKTMSS